MFQQEYQIWIPNFMAHMKCARVNQLQNQKESATNIAEYFGVNQVPVRTTITQ